MGMGFIKKSERSDSPDPRGARTANAEKASIPGERAGSVNEPSDVNKRYAAFLGAVAGDCGCERCCGLRDTAHGLLNPSTDY